MRRFPDTGAVLTTGSALEGRMQGLHFTGMESEEREALHALFDALNTELGRRFSLVDEEQAQILIVDVDSIYGQMTWLRAQNEARVVVPLSAGSRTCDGPMLSRPVTREKLLQLLQTLASQAAADMPDTHPEPASAAPAGANSVQAQASLPVTPAVAAPESESIGEPPRAPRLGDWLEPGVLTQAVRVVRAGSEPLVLDPGSRMYFGHSALKSVLPYCRGEMPPSELQPVSEVELANIHKAGGAQPMARLRWLFALVSGEGQLLPGYGSHERYSLTKWPQIEREFPKHFRIATAMMKGPATPAEIALQSSAPENEVIDFINASLVTGFAVVHRTEAKAEPVPARAGLLGRLRGKKD